jgi:hypothetical protein
MASCRTGRLGPPDPSSRTLRYVSRAPTPPTPFGCAAWLLRTELTIKCCHRSELGHPTRGIRRLLPPARGYVNSTRGLQPTRDDLTVPGQVRAAEPGNRLLTGWCLEVDRAIENLVKSGKMFGPPGGRRELLLCFPPRSLLDENLG